MATSLLAIGRSQEILDSKRDVPKLSSNSLRVVSTKSRHFLQQDAPALIVESVREVVRCVRAKGRIDDAPMRAHADG